MLSKAYRFGASGSSVFEKTGEEKKLLGGKGAALVKMVKAGLNVPPGYTYTTEACNYYRSLSSANKVGFLDTIMEDATSNQTWLANHFGYMPLVSVRSGAPISMPGMMDTILNVGLNDSNIKEWETRLNPRAAWDSYRRLIQMLGSTAYGVDMKLFDAALDNWKKVAGVEDDADLDAGDLEATVGTYKDIFKSATNVEFPQNPITQLRAAIRAVFDSWMNERAIEYRKLNKIPEDMGTAVNVQAMVFGNMNDASGTGVLFTRDPSTGDEHMMGEFLQNAQGEDVVAGIRTPLPINVMPSLGGKWPDIRKQLSKLCLKLEASYKDMVDIEFTVQDGELFILQSRTGKRSANAAFTIAHDFVKGGTITWPEAFKRVTKEQFKIARRPSIDPNFKTQPHVTGLPACPGVATGRVVFSAKEAVDCDVPCILVAHETTPEDLKGMNAAVGILTKTGGATSHAAVVARAMDKPCVVGCSDLDITGLKKLFKDKTITIDGATGKVWFDVKVPVVDSSDSHALAMFMREATNALEVTPRTGKVYDDGRAHTVDARYWWGDKSKLLATLDQLIKLPLKHRQYVTLSIETPPYMVGFATADGELENCFGAVEIDDFAHFAMQKIMQVEPMLSGLSVVGLPDGYPAIVITKVSSVQSLPEDYAVFSVLEN